MESMVHYVVETCGPNGEWYPLPQSDSHLCEACWKYRNWWKEKYPQNEFRVVRVFVEVLDAPQEDSQ